MQTSRMQSMTACIARRSAHDCRSRAIARRRLGRCGMSEWIDIEAMDGHRLQAWLAAPAAPPRGAVVVIQEIFGVNAHIRGVAERFAAAGWLAIAPAVMDRVQRGVELDYDDAGIKTGRELVAQVGFDNAVRDVDAAARHVGYAGKVATCGFCWGGTVSFLSCTRLKLPAGSYYGGRTVPFLHERPGAPLLMHFGERDPIITPEHRQRTIAALPEAEAHVYDAGHGFNCEARADYDREASSLAWQRTLDFLARTLAP
jgi:carboxymethylenebutenolidase